MTARALFRATPEAFSYSRRACLLDSLPQPGMLPHACANRLLERTDFLLLLKSGTIEVIRKESTFPMATEVS